jgi:hypothetical protein
MLLENKSFLRGSSCHPSDSGSALRHKDDSPHSQQRVMLIMRAVCVCSHSGGCFSLLKLPSFPPELVDRLQNALTAICEVSDHPCPSSSGGYHKLEVSKPLSRHPYPFVGSPQPGGNLSKPSASRLTPFPLFHVNTETFLGTHVPPRLGENEMPQSSRPQLVKARLLTDSRITRLPSKQKPNEPTRGTAFQIFGLGSMPPDQ